VFLRRADAEQRARSAELEIESIHRRNEQRMQSLVQNFWLFFGGATSLFDLTNYCLQGEELRSEYVELQQENMHLNHEIMAREQRSSMLDDRLFAAQSELKKDIYANIYRGAKLQKQHAQLEQEQRRLEEETSTALTPDEMRERLMAKVQEDNAYIENAQRHLEQLEALCSTHEETLRQKRAQLTDSAKGSEHTTNYEKLVERDKKITEFLTTFPQERTDAQTQKDNLQASIVGLLNHISKGMGVQQSLQAANVPSSAALGDLKDELGFKKEQMQNSEQTLSHLQKELEKRQAELDKINALDSKISVELTTLNDKVKEMESDLVKFSNIDAQVQMANDQKKSLLMEKQRCKSKRDALQARAALCQQKLERQKQELQDSDVYKKLDALEQKARANGQNIYTIADFVTTRERETDYEEIQKHSLQLTQQINQLLVQQPV
jgi:chromosome segregation ATPase